MRTDVEFKPTEGQSVCINSHRDFMEVMLRDPGNTGVPTPVIDIYKNGEIIIAEKTPVEISLFRAMRPRPETAVKRDARWLTNEETLILPDWMDIYYREVRDKCLRGKGHAIEETFDIDLISGIYEYLRDKGEEMQRRFRLLTQQQTGKRGK